MDKELEVYVKRQIRILNTKLESGQLNAQQQWGELYNICDKLSHPNIKGIPIKFNEYFQEIEGIENEYHKAYEKYINKLGEINKEIYEELKKL